MTNLVALLIVTNLVSVQCKCGFCNGYVVVPEHMNRVGYDLKEVVVTNRIPVVVMEVKK